MQLVQHLVFTHCVFGPEHLAAFELRQDPLGQAGLKTGVQLAGAFAEAFDFAFDRALCGLLDF